MSGLSGGSENSLIGRLVRPAFPAHGQAVEPVREARGGAGRSGDGRIVIEAARRFGTRGVGVDIDPVRVAEATANARRRGVPDRVRFRRQDLFETDLRPASIVTLYLFQNLNLELRPRLF